MSLQLSLQHALGLTESEAHLALPYFSYKAYPKNSLLQTANTSCSTLYFLADGYIRLFTYHEGKEITQWISTPNYFVTDLGAWLFDKKAKWNMQTLADCKVYEIEIEQYHKLTNQIANWSNKERYFIGHCFEMMEQRIYNFIALNSEERYNYFVTQMGYLFNEVPHQYIASILGITPETLSRIRRKNLSK